VLLARAQAGDREALETLFARYLMPLRQWARDRDAIVSRLELGRSYEELVPVVDAPSANAARSAVVRALMRLAARLDDAK
jgi:DNA-directed RNA polymerase specialized sigma24 family protein